MVTASLWARDIRATTPHRACQLRLTCSEQFEGGSCGTGPVLTAFRKKCRPIPGNAAPSEVSALYWTVPATDIVNPEREEQDLVSV
jgi:hypothetical protein